MGMSHIKVGRVQIFEKYLKEVKNQHILPHTDQVFCVQATIPCIDVSSPGKQTHSNEVKLSLTESIVSRLRKEEGQWKTRAL